MKLIELVDALCSNAKYFAGKLYENGFTVLNDVVFNQILIKCESSEKLIPLLRIFNSWENVGVEGLYGITSRLLGWDLIFIFERRYII